MYIVEFSRKPDKQKRNIFKRITELRNLFSRETKDKINYSFQNQKKSIESKYFTKKNPNYFQPSENVLKIFKIISKGKPISDKQVSWLFTDFPIDSEVTNNKGHILRKIIMRYYNIYPVEKVYKPQWLLEIKYWYEYKEFLRLLYRIQFLVSPMNERDSWRHLAHELPPLHIDFGIEIHSRIISLIDEMNKDCDEDVYVRENQLYNYQSNGWKIYDLFNGKSIDSIKLSRNIKIYAQEYSEFEVTPQCFSNNPEFYFLLTQQSAGKLLLSFAVNTIFSDMNFSSNSIVADYLYKNYSSLEYNLMRITIDNDLIQNIDYELSDKSCNILFSSKSRIVKTTSQTILSDNDILGMDLLRILNIVPSNIFKTQRVRVLLDRLNKQNKFKSNKNISTQDVEELVYALEDEINFPKESSYERNIFKDLNFSISLNRKELKEIKKRLKEMTKIYISEYSSDIEFSKELQDLKSYIESPMYPYIQAEIFRFTGLESFTLRFGNLVGASNAGISLGMLLGLRDRYINDFQQYYEEELSSSLTEVSVIENQESIGLASESAIACYPETGMIFQVDKCYHMQDGLLDIDGDASISTSSMKTEVQRNTKEKYELREKLLCNNLFANSFISPSERLNSDILASYGGERKKFIFSSENNKKYRNIWLASLQVEANKTVKSKIYDIILPIYYLELQSRSCKKR